MDIIHSGPFWHICSIKHLSLFLVCKASGCYLFGNQMLCSGDQFYTLWHNQVEKYQALSVSVRVAKINWSISGWSLKQTTLMKSLGNCLNSITMPLSHHIILLLDNKQHMQTGHDPAPHALTTIFRVITNRALVKIRTKLVCNAKFLVLAGSLLRHKRTRSPQHQIWKSPKIYSLQKWCFDE